MALAKDPLAEQRRKWPCYAREPDRLRWMSLSSFDHIPPPKFAGFDRDPTGWRFDVQRAGWDRWLKGIAQPLPPILIGASDKPPALRLADGNHRLTTARELGVPIMARAMVEVPAALICGWRVSDDADLLQTLDVEAFAARTNAPDVETAAALRSELVACVQTRMGHTSEDFTNAARAMFNDEGHGLACKVDCSWSDPEPLMLDLVRGLRSLPMTIIDMRNFLLARGPADDAKRATYLKRVIPTLRNAEEALDLLIRALEGER